MSRREEILQQCPCCQHCHHWWDRCWLTHGFLGQADSPAGCRLTAEYWTLVCTGKAELHHPRFKAPQISSVLSVFSLLTASPPTSRNSTDLRCLLRNPQSPREMTTYTTSHCILVWVISTAFFLTSNERKVC